MRGQYLIALVVWTVLTPAIASQAAANADAARPTTRAAQQQATALTTQNARFPNFTESLLTLDPPPVRSVTVDNAPLIDEKNPTVIPLPPAEWTGLLGLSALTLAACRKAFMRFIS